MAEQDDERIAEIRALHFQDNDDPFTCYECGREWPCDEAYVVARLDALTAERDALSGGFRHQTARRNDMQAERDALQIRVVLAEAERDALAARLAAAESALRAVGVPLINNVMCWCQESRDMAYGHSDACRQANAALAGSREQAATTTTRTITMRCHCGRGVTIGADPWCEGCVQSAATCDCVPVAQGEGA